MDADVIVVGAGLCRPGRRRRGGRRRPLGDRARPGAAAVLGGQAYWSLGGLFLVDSPEQRRLRIHDSAELALADWLGSAGVRPAGGPLAAALGGGVRPLRRRREARWLHGLGVRWFPLVQWAERGGYPRPATATRCPASTSPGAPVRAWSSRSPGGCWHSRRVRIRSRHRVTGSRSATAACACHGDGAGAQRRRRAASARPTAAVGDFSFSAQAVVVATGGIGGNLDLVRQQLAGRPTGQPPRTMIAGVPDYVDGSMLEVAEPAGGRVINPDRMWHYPEGIMNHSPVWSHHGIRILPGPSSLWLDAPGRRFPAPLFPGFDALGALRHITATGY